MKTYGYGVSRDGEHVARFDTKAEAETEKVRLEAESAKAEAVGWGKAGRFSVVTITTREW